AVIARKPWVIHAGREPKWEVNGKVGVDALCFHFLNNGNCALNRGRIYFTICIKHGSVAANEVNAVFRQQSCCLTQCSTVFARLGRAVHCPETYWLAIPTVNEVPIPYADKAVFAGEFLVKNPQIDRAISERIRLGFKCKPVAGVIQSFRLPLWLS